MSAWLVTLYQKRPHRKNTPPPPPKKKKKKAEQNKTINKTK